eukprot:2174-Heterococcus_DN1.PRE.2
MFNTQYQHAKSVHDMRALTLSTLRFHSSTASSTEPSLTLSSVTICSTQRRQRASLMPSFLSQLTSTPRSG